MAADEKGTLRRMTPEEDPTPTPPPAARLSFQVIASVAGGILGVALFAAGAFFAAARGVFSPWALLPMGASLALYVLLLMWDRRLEEESSALRRTLHGFNVFLMSGLLLVVLGIVNVMVFKYVRQPVDLTGAGYFSLADQTTKLLESLKQPATVTVVFPEQSGTLFGEDRIYVQARYALEDMLDLYLDHTGKLEVDYVDPYKELAAAEELKEKYPELTLPAVLMTYGEEDGRDHEIIKFSDLLEEGEFSETSFEVNFKAEDAITSALSRLTEGGRHIKVYFTAGNGELDPEDSSDQSMRGIGLFKQRLEDLRIEVAALDPGAQPKVPDDADLVIVAGPQSPLSQAAVQSLSDYMNRGGKMIVMADRVVNPLTQEIVDLGLGDFLSQYEVQLTNQRVHRLMRDLFGNAWVDPNDPRAFEVDAFPTDERTQLVDALGRRPTTMYRPSPVRPSELPATPPGTPPAGKYSVTSILEGGVILPEEGEKAQTPVSLAVAVSEQKQSGPPPMPGHPPIQQGGREVPRMIVFGDCEFAANRAMLRDRGAAYSILMSSVNWLRGRMELLGIPPKSRQPLTLQATTTEQQGMVWKPTLLMLAALVAIGMTVWMVRHRA